MRIIVNGSAQLDISLPCPFMTLSECSAILPPYLRHCFFYLVFDDGHLLPLHSTDVVVDTLTLAAYGVSQAA